MAMKLKIVLVLVLGALFVTGMKLTMPDINTVTLTTSAVLFMIGIGYGILERSILAIVTTLIAVMCLPSFVNYFTQYWPSVKYILFK